MRVKNSLQIWRKKLFGKDITVFRFPNKNFIWLDQEKQLKDVWDNKFIIQDRNHQVKPVIGRWQRQWHHELTQSMIQSLAML